MRRLTNATTVMRTLKAVRRSRPVTWWTHARNRVVTISQGWATLSTPGSPDSLQTPKSPVRPPRPAMVGHQTNTRCGEYVHRTMDALSL